MKEENDLDFKSVNTGVMHACGHDIHITSLLGCAYILNKFKEDLDGSVKLIFQPAEEIGQGAKYMIENGVLSNEPIPKAIFGLHVWPKIEAGKIYHRHGKMCACSDTFDIVIRGKSGHEAHPENSVDPIMILGNLICAIQNILSRETDSLEQSVITISAIHAGDVYNTIPDEVSIKGAIRALSEDTRIFLHDRLREIAKGVCETFRASCEVNIHFGTPVSFNEDFAYYGQVIPAAMYRLGTGFKNTNNAPLHSSKLLINEDALFNGILSMVVIAFNLLEKL